MNLLSYVVEDKMGGSYEDLWGFNSILYVKSLELFSGEPHDCVIFYTDGNWIEKKIILCGPKGFYKAPPVLYSLRD